MQKRIIALYLILKVWSQKFEVSSFHFCSVYLSAIKTLICCLWNEFIGSTSFGFAQKPYWTHSGIFCHKKSCMQYRNTIEGVIIRTCAQVRAQLYGKRHPPINLRQYWLLGSFRRNQFRTLPLLVDHSVRAMLPILEKKNKTKMSSFRYLEPTMNLSVDKESDVFMFKIMALVNIVRKLGNSKMIPVDKQFTSRLNFRRIQGP